MRAARFGFEVTATDGAARRGRLATAHGIVNTPAFMPVGTQGTVKAMTSEAVAATGAEILLGNTYFNVTVEFPEPIVINGKDGDHMSLTIQDDLSSLLLFSAFARGSLEI